MKRPITDTEAFCPTCGKCLDIAYDYELAKTRLRELPMAERPGNIWRLSELLPIRSSRAQAEVGQISGMTPLIPANRLGATGPEKTVFEGRQHAAPEPVLQGQGGVHRDRARAGARQERDRVRVDGQRGHSRGFAGGQGGADAVCVLSQPSRGDQGARVPCARREGMPGGRQLRRSQPRVSQGGGGERAGVREHHSAALLCGGRQDDGFRDRRAARLEGARPHRLGDRRRDAVLALAQGTGRVGDSRPGTD